MPALDVKPPARTQPLLPSPGRAPGTRPLGAGAALAKDVLRVGANLWTDRQAQDRTSFLVKESRFLGVNHRLPAGIRFDMDDLKAVDAFARGPAPSALNARERYQLRAATDALAAEAKQAGFESEAAALAAKPGAEAQVQAHKAALIQAIDAGTLTLESLEVQRFNYLNEILDACAKSRDVRNTATAVKYFLAGDDAGLAGLAGSLELRNTLTDKDRQAYLETTTQQAIAQLQGNQRAEMAAFNQLPPADQARFRLLKEQTREDPHARLALQGLLVEGKLGQGRGQAGPSLMAALGAMAEAPLAEGVDRKAFLAETIQEIATPGAISQQDKGTCAVAAVQIMMAAQHPAEYVRILTGLARPEGRVTLAGGASLPRYPGAEQDDGSTRTTGSRLWQASLMDFANGERSYDAAADRTFDVGAAPETQGGQYGLRFTELDRAVDALAGRDVPLAVRPGKQDLQADPAARAGWRRQVSGLLPGLARGQALTVSLEWGGVDAAGHVHGGHQLVAKAYDPATRTVTLQNPWGKTDTMSLAEFERRLVAFEQVDFTPGAHPRR